MPNRKTNLAAIVAGLSIAASPSFAQQLEEVIVSAQKREQSLMDVPIAVSALGADALHANVITSVFDLKASVPSLDVRAVDPPSVGTAFALRGLGTSVFNMGFEPTVATFVDGVYRARSGLLAATELVDMERIEVLKGPQGTLFGKNSTGGVVSMYTKKPNLDETEGFIDLGVESYSGFSTHGAVNVPLAPGKAALRLTGGYSNNDGWLDNKATGNKIHDHDRYNIRAQLLFMPNEDLSVRIIGDYAKLDEKCCTALHFSDDPNSAAVNGPLAAAVDSTHIANPDISDYDVALNVDPKYKAKDRGISMEINWDIGEVTLTSISAYRKFEDRNYKDNDFGGVDMLYSNQNLPGVKLFSQELRLAGTTGKLDWTVGGYYSKEEMELTNEFIWGSQATFFAPDGSPIFFWHTPTRAYLASFDQEVKSYAVFAHGIFHLSDRMALTAGIRYTDDSKDGTLVNDHPLGNFGFPNVFPLSIVHDYDAEQDDDEVSGTLSLQYDFSDDVMGYISYTHGYKSGGISMTRDAAGAFLALGPAGPAGPFPAQDPTFDKETADSFEAGIKATLADRRVRLLAAVWHTEFDDLQVQVLRPDGSFGVDTAKGATSEGVEVETNIFISDNFTLNASVQYLDATYDNGVGALTPGNPSLDGEDLATASEWTTTISANFEQPVSDQMAVFLNASFFATSKARLSAEISPSYNQEQGGYELWTLRGGVKSVDEKWELSAWCRNCADKAYATSKFQIPFDGNIFFGQTVWSHIGAPRTWGVTGTYRF